MSNTSLYTTTASTTRVSSTNYTTLYSNTAEINNVTKNYGNSNVAHFLLAGTDGANTINGITDEGFLTVAGISTLGNVGNVKITGGNTGYILSTDGGGNLTFIDPSTITGSEVPYIHFDVVANGNGQQFSTANISLFDSNVYINLFKNGVNIEPTEFEKIDSNTIQVNIPLTTGDSIDILATSSGGASSGTPGGVTNDVQFNDGTTFAGSNQFTFDAGTNTLSVTNLVVPETVEFTDVGNITILGGTSGQLLTTDGVGNLSWTSFVVTDANYANFAGTAFSVAGANVTGVVANATYAVTAGTANAVAGANVSGYVPNATHATIADSANAITGANVVGAVANATYAVTAGTANSVAVANVSGIGNIATINLNGVGSNVLLGNGTWGSIGATANSNYANYAGNAFSVTGGNVSGQVGNALVAGTVYSNAQANITSLGTLSSLTVQGMTSIQEAKEKFTSNGTGATGTVNFDVLTSAIILQTANASANFTLNIRGNSSTTFDSITSNGESMSVTYVNKNGATAYYANVIQVDGSTVTPVWGNGTAPTSGNVSSYDVYNFNILKTGTATFVVFATIGDYS